MGEEEVKIKGCVAIIEDEEAIREMYRTKFTIEHYRVIEAANGKDGLELIKKEKPDIVLLDIFMPIMNGFDVLTRLKNDPDPLVKKIPVLILTNLAEDAGFERGIGLGAAGYVMKVTRTPDQLVQLTKAVIKSSQDGTSNAG